MWWGDVRIVYHSDEGALGRTVKNDERKLSFDVSQGMICGTAPSVPQGTVSLYDDAHLICSFRQSIQLFQWSYVLDVAIKQAEYIVHNRESPAEKRQVLSSIKSS